MEAGKDLDRDWSSLPPEVLNLIAKYLYEIIDFVRFRAVCKAWRFSTPITDLPPQFPWIFYDHDDSHEQGLRFFSISSNKFYTIHASKSFNKNFNKSFDGYYDTMFCDEHKYYGSTYSGPLSLINPLNNDCITLPPFPLNNDGAPPFLNQPIWVGHGLNHEGEYMVCCALQYMDSWGLKYFFCRVGQEYWCDLKLDGLLSENVPLPFYLNGRIFTVNVNGVTKVTDITSGTLVYDIPPDPSTVELRSSVSFVEDSGKIIRVYQRDDHSDNDSLYDFHELVINNRGFPSWVKVKNIGDYAIFKHHRYSECVMVKASDLTGTRANCFYVLKRNRTEHYGEDEIVIERIDIETNDKELIKCPLLCCRFHSSVTWHIPKLHRLFTQYPCN